VPQLSKVQVLALPHVQKLSNATEAVSPQKCPRERCHFYNSPAKRIAIAIISNYSLLSNRSHLWALRNPMAANPVCRVNKIMLT